MFVKQKAFCSCCGVEYLTDFRRYSKYMVCSPECFEEMEWRSVLCIMGKEYYPDPHKLLKEIVREKYLKYETVAQCFKDNQEEIDKYMVDGMSEKDAIILILKKYGIAHYGDVYTHYTQK